MNSELKCHLLFHVFFLQFSTIVLRKSGKNIQNSCCRQLKATWWHSNQLYIRRWIHCCTMTFINISKLVTIVFMWLQLNKTFEFFFSKIFNWFQTSERNWERDRIFRKLDTAYERWTAGRHKQTEITYFICLRMCQQLMSSSYFMMLEDFGYTQWFNKSHEIFSISRLNYNIAIDGAWTKICNFEKAKHGTQLWVITLCRLT